ncbi:uncharacterized protein LOC125034736 isoform X2 [Penaeus chinensis]|uniref:uncharacterized protein LOC125034736 isoform X2 n=1 Tax=Penaeus chinensis TaxID=139456 RepID=UPI001FB60A44|nr:uncharacterized protein LOC125034736 isoform X2 [Penaeus chinensis]XP_047482630.1 uncharacterized protein LOC125034736 isoform X2 [Penaeus chinensis]
MCAVVTRDAVFPRNRQAHPTAFVKTVSPSGVPLLVRRPQAPSAPTLGGFQSDPASRPPPPPVPKRIEDSGARASQGGTFAVLPPIKTSGQKSSDGFSLTELEDISLKNELARVLKDVSDKTLQALLRNLRSQDRDRDGILTTDFLKGSLRKFQIYLSPDGQKNLCKKFGETGERSAVVRYENMFAYMTKTRLEAIRAPPPKPQQEPRKSDQQQQQRLVNLRNKVLFSDRDEAKLIIDLERQLADKQVNMADLRRTMYDLDRDRNDFLSGEQVKTALQRCNVDLPPDLLARLLLATDRTGAAMHKIEALMNYLTRVKPEAHGILIGSRYDPPQARGGRGSTFQSQSSLQPSWGAPTQPLQQLQSKTDYLPDEGFIEGQTEAPGSVSRAPSLAPSPAPFQSAHSPAGPEEEEEEEEAEAQEPFNMHKWSEDYVHLAQAVYGADHDQAGYLPPEEVRHVASTYNLVYNLNISEASLTSAISSATDPSYGEVNLEYFVASLQDLHFHEKGAY